MTAHTVPAGVREETLARYLHRAWPLLPGHVTRTLLAKKDVRINGAKSGADAAVHGGDALEIYLPEETLFPAAQILFDDGCLLAAVKPQGLPTQPDRDGVGADTMEMRLKRIHAGARLCNRLDTPTGGVLIGALDDETEALAFAAFKAHALKKNYIALLCAKPPRAEMTLRGYLVKDARHAEVRIDKWELPGAKAVETRLRVLDACDGFCRVALEPVTGRTHQLRAHMASIGCPILGDDKYGDRAANRAAGYAGRLCLWCESIAFFADGALGRYAGERFCAPAPDWRVR